MKSSLRIYLATGALLVAGLFAVPAQAAGPALSLAAGGLNSAASAETGIIYVHKRKRHRRRYRYYNGYGYPYYGYPSYGHYPYRPRRQRKYRGGRLHGPDIIFNGGRYMRCPLCLSL